MDCYKCKSENQNGARCTVCGASLLSRPGGTDTFKKSDTPDLLNVQSDQKTINRTGLIDVLRFRVFMTPVYIEIIFWIGFIFNLIWSLSFSVKIGSVNAFIGILSFFVLFIATTVIWRVCCELIIVVFRIYEELRKNNSK